MTTLVFTICARNYVGLARVLGRSIKRQGIAVDFRIYVADPDEADPDNGAELFAAPAVLAPYIGATEYANMAFMYNVTEFCTALKAACFMHGFADGYERCIYLDPDTFVAGNLGDILKELDSCEILITPHLCLPASGEGPRRDRGILATGVYNLGFLGLRRGPETGRFLTWWHERLRGQAFNDHYNALFTDQRWIDFVPSLFDGGAVRVWRHLGCNVAPWNFHERRVEHDGSGFLVRPRAASESADAVSLVFLHFSGFDFRAILDGRFDQLNLADAQDYPDLAPVYAVYEQAIQAGAAEMSQRLAIPYGHERYANGDIILPSHRRLFRALRECQGDVAAPFATGPGTFHAALARKALLARAGERDVAADKATVRSVSDPDRLLRYSQTAFRLAFRLLGRARFFFLLRGLNRLAHVEQHYGTFELDKEVVALASRGKGTA